MSVAQELADEINALYARIQLQSEMIGEQQETINDFVSEIQSLTAQLAACQAGSNPDLLLPPDGKLYLGVSRGVADAGYLGFVEATDRAPHIWHEYATSGDGFARDLARCPADSIPLLNFKPQGRQMDAASYLRILGGVYDTELDTAADALIANGRDVFVAIMHEMEDNDPTGESDSAQAEAFSYCVGYMRSLGARFVSVWNPMGYFPRWGHRYDTLYPGDDVVDWVAWDPYVRSAHITRWLQFIDRGEGFLTWCRDNVPGKPLMLAEWGIDAPAVHGAAPYLLSTQGLDQLLALAPEIRALVYWNAEDQGDYRLSNPGLTEWFKPFSEQPAFDFDVREVTG